MPGVTGIGGVFFKAMDPKAQTEWYRHHLGIPTDEGGNTMFWWRADDDAEMRGCTVWSTFPADTTYFGPGTSPFMINYRVDDLHALLAQLRKDGVQVDDCVEEHEYGRFGWIVDPEGNRIELWEPPAAPQEG